jgi:putative flippase GtrA
VVFTVALIERLWKFRFVRFGTIGAICSCLQLIVLVALARQGISDPIANVAGIISGALLSFPLSKRFTWPDRAVGNHAIAWTTFMLIAFSAFAASEGTFIVSRHAGVPRVLASVLGICVSILVTWTGNNRLTFRRERTPDKRMIAGSNTYPIDLSIVVPAYNEEPFIGRTLDMLADILERIELGIVEVIVVAASGTDDTALIAKAKEHLFPHFQLIQPGPKVGKGRDVREGMLAARGRYRMFMDADLATPLPHLEQVSTFIQGGGSVGIGVRNIGMYHKSFVRNLISVINSLLTRLVAVPGVRDTRCGFKVFEAQIATHLFSRMRMPRWGFDTEILALAKHHGHEITTFHIPDWHDPKENGSGLVGESVFRAVLQSALDPFKVRWGIITGRYRQPVPRHSKSEFALEGGTVSEKRSDRTAWTVAFAAAIMSITAVVVVVMHHAVLQFADANSYLLIARRTIDGTTPGLAQLGGSWLPLPDALELPFAWNGQMYRSGMAGSVWSMAAYVVSVVLIYLIVYRLTGKKIPGMIAASVFGLSVYVLYLQSTPMTETLMFATLLAAVFFTQQWIVTDKYRWLVAAGAAELLATITRYESWPVAAMLALITAIVAWRRQLPDMPKQLQRRRARDRLVIIGLLDFAGIAFWFLWCQVIFGNALYFMNGTFAKPPVGHSPAIGNLWIATKTYVFAMVDTVGTPVLVLGALGVAVFVIRALRHKEPIARMMPAVSLLIVIPFYIFTVYMGQRPLDVMQLAGHNYNVRYGMLALLPAAIFIGYLTWYLTSVLKQPALKLASNVAVVGVVIAYGVVTLQAGISQLVGIEHATVASAQAAQAFNRYYTGGLVLMQSWGNEALIEDAVPVNKLVDEGSNGLWKPALRSPIHNDITTIVTRSSGDVPDAVRAGVNAGELSHYRMVWENGVYKIYEVRRSRVLASASQR